MRYLTATNWDPNRTQFSFSGLVTKKFLTQWRSEIDFVITSVILDLIQSDTSHKNFLSGDFSQSMFLDLPTQEETVDICKFPTGKSAGYDNIPTSIIKRSINSIFSPLTHIVNLSIIHGVVPNELKFALVVPIFKSGDKALFSNYRHISVLLLFEDFGTNNL